MPSCSPSTGSTAGGPSTGIPLWLSHRPHPFSLETNRIELPSGLTLYEILEVAQPDPAARELLAVRIAGHDVPRENWRRVRPKPGMLIEAVALPAGGGNTLRTVLMIAIVAAAMATGAWIAGPTVLALEGAAFTFASAGIGGALTLGGMLALNALIPPPKEQMNNSTEESQTYGIEGAQNAPRLNAPVPVVLGTHKVVPALAAPWLTVLDGDDEYLFGLVCWCIGPASVEALQIGDTPIEEFQGVQLEHYFGDQETNPTFSLYPSSVTTTPIGVLLESGQREVRRTDTDTDYVVLEFQFREGCIKYGEKTGDPLGVEVELRFRYRLVGDGAWSTETITTVAGKQASPKRTSRRISFPARGQYELEVRRVTSDSTDSTRLDKVTWENIKSFNGDSPVRNAQAFVLTALRIKASNQLSGVIRDLSGIVRSYGAQWNGSAWVYGATNQPAALFRRLLQGRSVKKPVADGEIDLPQLQYWAERTSPRGEFCNFVADRDMSIWDLLVIICGTGRATPSRADGKWSVVIDEPKPFFSQMFTPRNYRELQVRRIFTVEPHGLRMTFVDEANGFSTQTREVYHDGYGPENATLFEEGECPGVTNADAVWRLGRWRLAEGRLRPETMTFITDFEHLVSRRGDKVGIQSTSTLWGRSSGRIRSVILDEAGLMAALTLDEAVVFDMVGDFVIRIRLRNNSQIVLDITEPVGETKLVYLTTPVVNDFVVAPGDLYVIGIAGKEVQAALIRAIEPMGDLEARITCVPYDEGVYTADTALIPPWDPNITPLAGQEAPIIRAVTSGDAAAIRHPDGSLEIRALVLLWDDGTRPLATLAGIDIAWKPLNDDSPFVIIQAPPEATTVVLTSVPFDQTIRVNARYRYSTGRLGRWGSEVQPFIVGPRLPPADVKGVILDGLWLRWIFAAGPDHQGFKIRWASAPGQAWEDCEDVTDQLVTDTSLPAAAIPANAQQVLIKAVTIHGTESVSAARLTVTPTTTAQRVPLGVDSIRDRGWPGLLTNAEVIAGEVLGTDGSLFLDGKGRFLTPVESPWLAGVWSEVTYIVNVVTPTTLLKTDRLFLQWDIDGDYKIAYRWGTADLTFVSFESPLPDDFLAGSFDLPLGADYDPEVLLVWRAWRQGIPALAGEPLQLRVIIAGGGVDRPAIRGLQLVFDGEEIEETFTNVNVPAAGILLDLERSYRVVSHVLGSVRAGSAARTFVVDAATPTRVKVRLLDAAGTSVPGVADFRVGGG
ncbi:MAG: hypothetical protein RJA36_1450 [Pseudomonadota bacterium]|jgi:predicted phage tail protein